MARAASKDIVILGSRRKAKLEAITRRASAPQALARRARIVLLAHAGWPNAQIAAELGCAAGTVRTWRRRFARGGIPALAGRPEVYGPSVRLALVAAATSVPPDDRPEWTHALIAAELAGTGISASQAGRILADLELRPHKVRGWLRRADDAQFWAQAAAVCDAYLRPPPGTIVICIDEKTGIQAKYRKYPGRLPAPGRPARREFEYVRNGTVSVIAALHVATGQVVTEPAARNDSAAFTSFLHRLTQCIDPRLNIRIVMDNGSSHTSRATRAWIAARPRITVTYTPKHASWLDIIIELWSSVLTRGLLHRGEFTSRADLIDKITRFTIRYNTTARPWTWAYDARDDHARYRARHHPQAATAHHTTGHQPDPAAGRLTAATASKRPIKDFCGAALV
jgi:transposase